MYLATSVKMGVHGCRAFLMASGCRPNITGLFRNMSSQNAKKDSAIKFSPGKRPADFKAEDVKAKNAAFYRQFATPAGRKRVALVASVIGVGILAYKTVPSTYGQEYTQMIYQHYSKGLQTRVTKQMEALIQGAMEEQHLSPEEIDATKAFVSVLQEAFSWGGFGSSSGLLLSYPQFFHYTSVKDIPLGSMRFGVNRSSAHQSAPTQSTLESPEAKMFQNSLVLSNEAKRFVIARELQRGRLNTHKTEATFAVSWFGTLYFFNRFANQYLGLFKVIPFYRLAMYTVTGTLWGASYFVLNDWIRVSFDKTADEQACREGGVQYCRGGVEYYDKMLQRNVALRALLPDDEGKKMYTRNGDFFPGLIRTKVTPISARKQVCSKILEELQG